MWSCAPTNRNQLDCAMLPEKDTVQILLVDDHPIVREGMAMFLALQANFKVCCQAGTPEEALDAFFKFSPALAIVDISLGKDSGLDLVKSLRRHSPRLPILVMSQHEESIFAERALRSGANGYVMKHEITARIVSAIHTVMSENVYLSEAMHERLARGLARTGHGVAGPLEGLTEREFEVLHLLGLGLGTREISEKLNRSIKTIETHRARLKEKLQLKTGAELARFAGQWLESK